MGRPVNPESKYRIKPHVTNGYTYASTQPPYENPSTGKKSYRYVHWGLVDKNLKFIPSAKYILASIEERSKLIFPSEWDMSEIQKLSGFRTPGRPSYDGEELNRLYGDIWLLEEIAQKTGIRQDLDTVFHGNQELVDDIMTLAMFPYLTKYNYNRVVRWQKIQKTPSLSPLTSTAITRLTQAITEQNRMDLLRLRARRLNKDELCAVDSTTRSSYDGMLTDIRWGKNKDQLPLKQTTEVVVYTLSSHMPVYYRTFPGNMPDSRSLETILLDLKHASFQDMILITDRGYENIKNLEKYILGGHSMIMCTKVGQKIALDHISEFGEFSTRPEDMQIDPDTKIYYKQYDIDYKVESTGQSSKSADRLKLNLYFDAVRRSSELVELDIVIDQQQKVLEELLAEQGVMEDDATIKRAFRYFTIVYEPLTRIIQAFKLNEEKVRRAKRTSGFFAIVTHKLDFAPIETLKTYRLRDEQEKYFQQMKDQMGADRQRNWSEEGKSGRLFILFVSLILSSYVRHIWKSTVLHDKFATSLDILDEMRSIRCIEHTNRAKYITPFVGAQVDICEAFNFQIPKGCAPLYMSKKKAERKRGRPRKKVVEKDL